ncbi:MAG: hypothetical protein Q7V31_11945 [Parvibaculum sp.]|uniref:hypothetical protein n=1 Tax=Parvibaculum sp. TaxID=2024848 RepID=UPI00271E3F9A|nr:hypothetical protein [Parvibaculum sp.]MDO8839630.1 hypothetical protein [Parvibaculum sp.]
MKHAARIAKVLEEFQKLDPTISLTTVHLFMVVVAFPGRTVRYYCDYTGQSQAAVSRNMRALADRHRLGRDGLGLLSAEPDPSEVRRVLLHLTARGKRLAQTLEKIMGE